MLASDSRIILTPGSVKLPKSFVAIDLSEKEAFERRSNSNPSSNGLKKEAVEPEAAERGRSEERRADVGAAATADVPPVKELPSPILNGSSPS